MPITMIPVKRYWRPGERQPIVHLAPLYASCMLDIDILQAIHHLYSEQCSHQSRTHTRASGNSLYFTRKWVVGFQLTWISVK